jgi:DNA-binding NarL/FixJ family response regulator
MRAIIIDDHKIFGEGLSMILEKIDISVVRVFQDPKEALLYFDKFQNIDIIFTDINMPEINGFKLCEKIKNINSSIKIIVLSMYDDKRINKHALKCGADIYLTKTASKEDIKKAVKNCFLNKNFAQKKSEPNLIKDKFTMKYKLTKREREILVQILDEKSNQEIAEVLQISKRTVETHRKNIQLKLKAKNSVGIVKIALQYDLGVI